MGFSWAFLVRKEVRRSSSPPRLSVPPSQAPSQDPNQLSTPGIQSQGEAEVIAWLRGESSAALAHVIDKQERAPRKLVRKLAPATQGTVEVRQWMYSTSPRALESVLRARDRCSLDAPGASDLSPLLPSSPQVGSLDAAVEGPPENTDTDNDWSVGVDTPEGEIPLPASPLEPRYVSLTLQPESSESSGSRTPTVEDADEDPTSGRGAPFLDLYRGRSVSIVSRPSLNGGEDGVILPLASATVERANQVQLPSSSQSNPSESCGFSSSTTDGTPGSPTAEDLIALCRREDEGHVLPLVVGQPMKAQAIEVVNSEDEPMPPNGYAANKPEGSGEYEILPTGEVISIWSDSDSSDADIEYFEIHETLTIFVTPPSPPVPGTEAEGSVLLLRPVIQEPPPSPQQASFNFEPYDESADGEEPFVEDEDWMGGFALERRLEETEAPDYQTLVIDPVSSPPKSQGKKPKHRPAALTIQENRPRQFGKLLEVPEVIYRRKGDRRARNKQQSVTSSSESSLADSPSSRSSSFDAPPPTAETSSQPFKFESNSKIPLNSPAAAGHLSILRQYLSLPPSTTPGEIQQILSRNPEIVRHSLLGRISNPHLADSCSANAERPLEIEPSVATLRACCDAVEALFALAWDRTVKTGGELTLHLDHCDSVMNANFESGDLSGMDHLEKVFVKELKRQGRATFAQRTRLVRHLDIEDVNKLADGDTLVKADMMDRFIELVEMGIFTSKNGVLREKHLVARVLDVPSPLNKEQRLAQIRYNRAHPTPSQLRLVEAAEALEYRGKGKEPAV